MPLFQVDVEKRLGSEFWSNRYIVEATNIALAQSFAPNIINFERSIHDASVTFTRYRVSSTAVGDGIYSIVPLNVGGLGPGGGTLLPLFNTLRMDLTASSGRPSRKFFRGVLNESNINGDAVVGNYINAAIELQDLLTPTPPDSRIVDPQGQTLTAVTVHPFVQMRQLRRSRRRRANGGGIFQ